MTLRFSQNEKNRVDLLVSHNGKRFCTICPNELIKDEIREVLGSKAKVKSISYTTKRNSKIIAYKHDFKIEARPQLDFLTRDYILSIGGYFEFSDVGFIDKR